MSYIADLHVHSHLSRATSKDCNLEGLHRGALLKGIRLVGTGDFTHPAWFAELREKLEPSAPGLFRLRSDIVRGIEESVPTACRAPVHFMITGEISSIYKRDGRVRKVHSLLHVPDLESAALINARLDALGNIKSDGRPILGLDPRDLLEIALESSADAYMIPAHIWTPWFSMLGSKSGFDSPSACFGDLARHIFAVETGLSSDPPMNWRVSSLDAMCLMSNSDLHSPARLGRNANIFHGAPDFFRIRDGLRRRDPAVCGGTIDMFPEEGKYHCDGHRKCGVCMEPAESRAHDCLCPVCGKPLTLGVLHRVEELADRPPGGKPAGTLPCRHIIPLPELLGEIYGCGAGTRKVTRAHDDLLRELGPEMTVLLDLPTDRVRGHGPALLAEALRRVRAGEVIRQPGYDGEYGAVRVFGSGEKDRLLAQGVFFNVAAGPPAAPAGGAKARLARVTAGPAYTLAAEAVKEVAAVPGLPGLGEDPLTVLTAEQRAAATATAAALVIAAGPGTGKTRTLSARIAYLVKMCAAPPASILAITFTNRAAEELRSRLQEDLGETAAAIRVGTFHAFCLRLLRQHAGQAGLPREFAVVDQDTETALLRARTDLSATAAATALADICRARRLLEDASHLPGAAELAAALEQERCLGLDAIVPRCLELLREHREVKDGLGLQWICVDEYQDVNRAQYELVRELARGRVGLCVIGDPDQAIYGFRGADVSFFLRFPQDFAGARTFNLSRNFRSTGEIVDAAAQVMSPGRTTMSASVAAVRRGGVRIRIHEAPTAAAEAEFITHEIEKWLGGTALFSMDSSRVDGRAAGADVSFGDIAVLVRLRALAAPLATALERLGLPVQTVADQTFVEQPGGREVIRLLRTAAARDPGLRTADIPALAEVQEARAAARPETRAALDECLALAAACPGPLTAFLDTLILRQGADRYSAAAERIVVMSLHAAKGLEFPIVFVAGCEDGILPYVRPGGAEPDLAEERRLLYVGMTRARHVLYLTHARRRTLYGRTETRARSPFLAEIESALLEKLQEQARRSRPLATQLEFDLGLR